MATQADIHIAFRYTNQQIHYKMKEKNVHEEFTCGKLFHLNIQPSVTPAKSTSLMDIIIFLFQLIPCWAIYSPV